MTEIEAWKHADFIYASYIVVGLGVGLLALWIFRDERKQAQLLEDLKAEDEG